MTITIEEPFGWADGKIIATPSSWRIRFYLKGPDLRYNGDFLYIGSQDVQSTIENYKKAFDRYEELKLITPKGAELSENQGQLTIRVGSFAKGVCMKNYHNPISTRSDLELVVSLYERALNLRGPCFVNTAKDLLNKAKP